MPDAAPAPPSIGRISGIVDHWERLTRRSTYPPADPMADRLRLDVLGLGIEQAHQHLGIARPAFDAFARWVVETAGEPDPDKVSRFEAWAAGAPAPAATAADLAAVDALPPVLDAADLDHWDRHGYVVLRGALSRAEAAAVEALVWRLVEGSPGDPASWYKPRVGGIMVGCFQDPALDAARRGARIHKAFAQLYGTSDLWSTTDRVGFNPPETPSRPFQGTGLHWDMSLAPPRPLRTGGVLYLTDTAPDGGAFRLVPGFHRRLDAWLATLGDADPRGVDLTAEAIPVPGGAGDLVIWRHDLPHGASPNTADRPRLVQYVNRYSPAMRDNPIWL